MDDCPLCHAKCYVVNTRVSGEGIRAGDAFVCTDCLVQWPTTGGNVSRFTNSVMSKALPTLH